jgi:hypothetical protein
LASLVLNCDKEAVGVKSNGLMPSELLYTGPVHTVVVMLTLALLTIGSQVYQIAVSNPVKTLRTE